MVSVIFQNRYVQHKEDFNIMVRDELGTRMKMYYESSAKTRLLRRTPVAIRIDGRAFHTFTKKFKKPFDPVLMETMQQTMLYLCENIQGCILGYTQSDEITLILCDFEKLDSGAWFDYEVQKLCSVSASMATLSFNNILKENVLQLTGEIQFASTFEGGQRIEVLEKKISKRWSSLLDFDFDDLREQLKVYQKACREGAMFDSRCFNIPKEEVTNLVYWRQLDATRNSIEMVGHYYFKQSELHRKTCNIIQDMLFTEKGINWNNFSTPEKRGSCCKKVDIGGDRLKWEIDKDIPVFKGDGREYIESLIPVQD